MCKHLVQFLFGERETFTVSAVHNQNDNLCVAVVRVPAGSKVVLSSDIPDQEVCFTYSDLLNIATDGWWCVHSFFCQKLIKDGCLPSIVQTHNDYFVLWGKKSRLHLPSANMFLFSLEHTSNLELHNSFQSKTRKKVHTDKIKDRQTSVIQSKLLHHCMATIPGMCCVSTADRVIVTVSHSE